MRRSHRNIAPTRSATARAGRAALTFGLAAGVLGAIATLKRAPAEAAVSAKNVVHTAVLDGTQVAPGPGDSDGSGAFVLQFSDNGRKMCWGLTVRDIDVPTAIRIHKAATGAAGPVVLGVKVLPATGEIGAAAGCVPAEAFVLDALRADATQFYVQVATKQNPNGTIRGQLR